MAIIVFVYLCCNGGCRNIERRAGVKKAQITCPVCGSMARLIGTERE